MFFPPLRSGSKYKGRQGKYGRESMVVRERKGSGLGTKT